MSKKITNRDIHDLFIKYFEGDKPFTASEKRMNGIKITQLRKNVQAYIDDNDIKTDQTVNEIIIDIIEYSKITGMKFRSVASLGFNVMPESIAYWKKRRAILAKQEEQKNAIEEVTNQNNEVIDNEVIIDSYDNPKKKQTPKWMNNDKGW